MDPSATPLMVQGLMIAAIGITLVFAALALLWGMTWLLTKIFADREQGVSEPVAPELSMALAEADMAEAQAALEAAAELTEERARVAAMVAGALLANALPLLFQPPTGGPAFEHGRIAPSWVTGNRARALQTWQPPRAAEIGQPDRD